MSVEAKTAPVAPARNPRFVLPPAMQQAAFRNYWLGTLASVGGFQMFAFGQLWLVHELTHSALFLGYVGLAQAAPSIILTLVGGVFADRVDRRRLILTTQVLNALLIGVLATLTLMGIVQVWHVLAVAVTSGAVNAFDQPARQALFPQLIDRKNMVSAVAMNSVIWQGSRIIAPAVAGVIVDVAGTATVFFVATGGFLIMAGVISRLRIPKAEARARSSAGRDMLEGLQFIRKNSEFSFLIGMTFFNSFFGMAYLLLMPVFAVDILEVGARGQGLLLSATGGGALLSTIFLSSRSLPGGKGFMIIGGAMLFGLGVAAFAITAALVGSFPLALGLMFLIGLANSMYMIAIMSSLQTMVPDAMRGRVMGFYGMTYSIMPLGGLMAGAIAGIVGTPAAVAMGGGIVSAFALGPAALNKRVRNLSALLKERETKQLAQRAAKA